MQTTNTPFLKHLSQNVTPHVIVTAEDEEFDDVFLQDLRDEGFDVHYVAQNDDPGPRFCNKLHALANQITGVSERYAIIGTFHPMPLSFFNNYLSLAMTRSSNIDFDVDIDIGNVQHSATQPPQSSKHTPKAHPGYAQS